MATSTYYSGPLALLGTQLQIMVGGCTDGRPHSWARLNGWAAGRAAAQMQAHGSGRAWALRRGWAAAAQPAPAVRPASHPAPRRAPPRPRPPQVKLAAKTKVERVMGPAKETQAQRDAADDDVPGASCSRAVCGPGCLSVSVTDLSAPVTRACRSMPQSDDGLGTAAGAGRTPLRRRRWRRAQRRQAGFLPPGRPPAAPACAVEGGLGRAKRWQYVDAEVAALAGGEDGQGMELPAEDVVRGYTVRGAACSAAGTACTAGPALRSPTLCTPSGAGCGAARPACSTPPSLPASTFASLPTHG